MESAREPSLGPRGPAPGAVSFLEQELIGPRHLLLQQPLPQVLDHRPEKPEGQPHEDRLNFH